MLPLHITNEKSMQITDIITSISFILMAIAVTVLAVLRILGLRKAMGTTRQGDIKAMIKRALKQLNVNAEWTSDKDVHTLRFAYQGGHFSIDIRKGQDFATLNYLYFYNAGIDSIENVRAVCNLCNLNADNCRIVYTVDSKESSVDVHYISDIHATREDIGQTLQLAMGEAFRWQNTFSKKLDDIGKDRKGDQEKKVAEMNSEIELMREQELTHQAEGSEWHESASQPFSLKHVIATTLGLNAIVPIGLTITENETAKTISDTNDILGMNVHAMLIDDGKFKCKSAFAKLDFYDPRDLSQERHLMMDLEADGQTKDTLYYRVTLSVSPTSRNSDTDINSWQRQKKMTSVLLGYDLTPSEDRLAHFNYVWKEAMSKAKNGDEANMTEEEKTLANMQSAHIAKNFHMGKHLYAQRRFHEALGHLTDAYHELEDKWAQGDRGCHDSLWETAYLVACCHMALGQYEMACFYIQATAPFDIGKFTKVYVNCLVNNKDFRALDAINILLDELDHLQGNDFIGDDDDDDEQYEPSNTQLDSFISFVRRRKAYLLVSLGRYDEAKTILTAMLKEPENSDFALNELAYIQKNK